MLLHDLHVEPQFSLSTSCHPLSDTSHDRQTYICFSSYFNMNPLIIPSQGCNKLDIL